MRDQVSATLHRTQCLAKFGKNEQFTKDLQRLETFLSKAHSKPHNTRCTYVELPQEIGSIFTQIGQNKVYLVGSTVLDLLSGTYNKTYDRDFDFSTNDKHLGPTLEKAGFMPIGFVPGLFRKRSERNSPEIDVMLSKLTIVDEQEPWIVTDLPQRDFTICALYCDHTGKVFDPTGKGLDDFKAKSLSTVVDPALCFQHDPICILRGLKYISRGFSPTPEVEKALKEWMPTAQIAEYIPHMAAVFRKLLRTNNNIQRLARQYGLTEKLKTLFAAPQYRQLIAALDEPLNFYKAVAGHEKAKTPIRYTTATFQPSRSPSVSPL